MPKNRPSSKRKIPLEKTNRNATKVDDDQGLETKIEGIENIRSLLDDENTPQPGTSSSDHYTAAAFSSNAAALYGELDSFRQRWKRDLQSKSKDSTNFGGHNNKQHHDSRKNSVDVQQENTSETTRESKVQSQHATLKESFAILNNPPDDPAEVYQLAKRLFLIGVDLEHDELHSESIRYYKQAMHLFPNIEKQIFREQLQASTAVAAATSNHDSQSQHLTSQLNQGETDESEEKIPLLDRIRNNHIKNQPNDETYTYCKPAKKSLKSNQKLHISQLPHDLMLKIFHHVIGIEIDLASLERLGMVCRGFYLLSNDQSLWRNICYSTWGLNSFNKEEVEKEKVSINVDWRQIFIDKPRVNCDGVYISRTRYIRSGDVGFQDITYRPFHLIRYYRYLRFFPDKRLLFLTTNEEPETIVPIFRHALNAKHFAPGLSVMEGKYEFIEPNQVIVVAEKDYENNNNITKAQPPNNRQFGNARRNFDWYVHTPTSLKFSMKLELKTNEDRPYRNNLLRWREYVITSKFHSGLTEVTKFDIARDTFPDLAFSRVTRFNSPPIEVKPLNSF